MIARGPIAVAMSGGVDSSVAAALLQEQGWEVVGITMHIWACADLAGDADAPRGCCGPSAVADARRIAAQLGIPHYVYDLRDVFQQQVIDPFCADYAAGRTPNPCIRCNRYVKFGAFAERARAAGLERIATGHYARIEHDADDRWRLRTGVDRSKDQSYVLYSLTQAQLAATVLPLGGLTKSEVRRRARALNLPVADKTESQELCFVVSDRYDRYLREHTPAVSAPGPILDTAGRRVGAHQGIAFYTVGQRKGLGLSGGAAPRYVVDLDAAANAVIVGAERELYRTKVRVGAVNYVARPELPAAARLTGKLRYRMAAAPCTVAGVADTLEAVFDQPQRAVTPGQAAVFYDDDVVVCGGVIERTEDAARR